MNEVELFVAISWSKKKGDNWIFGSEKKDNRKLGDSQKTYAMALDNDPALEKYDQNQHG